VMCQKSQSIDIQATSLWSVIVFIMISLVFYLSLFNSVHKLQFLKNFIKF